MRGWVWCIVAAIAAVAVAGFARPAHAEDAAAMLQKGIYQEETAGNIDGAIDVYKQIIDLDNANQATVAEAQYRLGECYLKKGRKSDAVDAFKSVAAKYEGRFAVAAKAKKKLGELTPAPGAPKVIRTVPDALANDVSSDLDKITVTFNQKMMNNSWSWTGGGETYPKTTGKPFYDESITTCTMPVKLEPGKVYWVGINSPSHRNFKTPGRVPAARYVILFATKGEDGKPTVIPEDMARNARQINAASAATTGEETAPVVVKTSPEAFATGVPADTKEITVTFDQPMTDGAWSWTGGGETYPKGNGPIHYDAPRTTCTMPVKLEPGKAYWVGINSPSHKHFVSAKNMPAPWYIIVFTTATADGKAIPIPDDMAGEARRINDAAKAAAAQASTEPTEEQQLSSESDSADGWRLWREGNYPDAEAKFKSAVAANPKNTAAWNGLGWAQFNQGKPMNAEKAFQKCVELDPNWSGAWNGLGYIAKGDGKTDEAIGYWRKAVEASPSATASLSGLAEAYMELKKPAEAEKYYRMWLEQESDNEDAKAGLAKAQEAQGKKPSVPAESTSSKKTDEEAAPAESEEESTTAAEPVKEVSGDKKQESMQASAAGWRLWMKKQYNEAEAQFNKALAADPGNVAAWNGLGWAQFNQGKALNATKSFKKCVELDPNVSGAWNGLGYISKNAGKTDDAITYWKKAIEVEPKATASLAGLARTYMELKKYDEAVKYYEMLVKASPKDAKAKSELQKAKSAARK